MKVEILGSEAYGEAVWVEVLGGVGLWHCRTGVLMPAGFPESWWAYIFIDAWWATAGASAGHGR